MSASNRCILKTINVNHQRLFLGGFLWYKVLSLLLPTEILPLRYRSRRIFDSCAPGTCKLR